MSAEPQDTHLVEEHKELKKAWLTIKLGEATIIEQDLRIERDEDIIKKQDARIKELEILLGEES